jgi:hypothetical protein
MNAALGQRRWREGTVLFTYGEFVIRSEGGSDYFEGIRIESYIYHKPCGGDGSDSNGWCSAWDVREGCCYYCKKAIPDDIRTVWLLMEGTKLGSYMLDKLQPWKSPGRPS